MFRLLFFVVIFSISIFGCRQKAQEGSSELKKINLSLNTSDFKFIYNHPHKDTNITVFVTYNEKSDSAKLRIRGSSSRDYDKKSLKLTFSNKKLFGEKKINLNSEFTDKSYVRQVLSTKLFQKSGQECFDVEHVIININDTFSGVYLLTENMDKSFLEKNNLPKNGNLYKATHDGACMSAYDDIEKKWEKKTNKKESWNDLKKLIKEVNTIPSKEFHFWLKQTFDYDELINYVATNMLIANGSTYYHNYYLYHNLETNKWKLLPWDLDKTISYYSWMPYQHNRTSSNWESDNPLVEKMLINDVVYNDIIERIKVLGKNVFSPAYTDHLIDSLEHVLAPYIELDSTDKISSINEWKDQLKKEKEFLDSHPKQILKQLENYPRGFEVEQTPRFIFPEFTLVWNRSKHPKSKLVKYKLLISHDFDFGDSITLSYELSDTSFMLPKTLSMNEKYFWKVIAIDGENETEGFNTKNFFTLKHANEISSFDGVLTKEKSPYIIHKKVILEKNKTLVIDPGVIIYMNNEADIDVFGNITAKNCAFISLKKEGSFNSIEFLNTSTSSFNDVSFKDVNLPIHAAKVSFDNCTFISEKRALYDGQRISLIWSKGGEVSIKNSYVRGNGTGEGINLNYSKSEIKNNFICSIPDAIELIDVTDGIIENNYVIASQDDAIDLNGCKDVLIKGNILVYNNDKGISIGAEQYGKSINIIAANNQILFNKIAVSVKDSSDITLKRNTITNNKIGVEAYKKLETYRVGGKATLKNNKIENNSENLKQDKWSEIVN
ncbi:MAG: CotH kinase family protein [Bacteroidia bacterium]